MKMANRLAKNVRVWMFLFHQNQIKYIRTLTIEAKRFSNLIITKFIILLFKDENQIPYKF